MPRRFKLSTAPPPTPIQDHILAGLYPEAAGMFPEAEPPAIEDQVFGGAAPVRNAILLSRLMRAEAGPRERSRFGFVE